MNRILQKIIMTVLTSLLATLSNAVAQTPEVELTHWWNTPGELAALNTIKSEVIKRGGKFRDVKIKSWDELHKSTINRLELGYPPAVTQWLSGTDLVELSDLKAITHPPESWRGEKTADVLFKEVFRDNQYSGKLINIPLGIHVQNSALFNADIYRKLKLPLPRLC